MYNGATVYRLNRKTMLGAEKAIHTINQHAQTNIPMKSTIKKKIKNISG